MARKSANAVRFFFGSKVLALCSIAFTSSVYASAFQIQEQSVSNLGTAYAGTAAWVPDVSSAFYNPAGLTRIKNNQIVASGIVIWASTQFEAIATSMPTVNSPVSGDPYEEFNALLPIPSLHYGSRLTDELVFGLSIAAPFGLKTSYDDQSILRFVATDSELRTIDIIPSLAWQATDWLSIAGGPDALYAEAKLCVDTNLSGIQGQEGFQKNQARTWALGWHLAFLADLSERTRVGLQYRSGFGLRATGDSQNSVPVTLTSDAGTHVTRQVQAKINLPETVVLSGYHELDDHWSVMADAAWVRWNQFNQLRLYYFPYSTSNLDTVTYENFTNTWRFALGTNYTVNKRWAFRTGIAWDQSPVQDQFRTARIPDSDRIWLGFGAGYTVSDGIHFDIAYAHLFFNNAMMTDTGPISIATGNPTMTFNSVRGDFQSNANIYGIQIRYDFE